MAGLGEMFAGKLLDILTFSAGITGATTTANADARLAGTTTIAVASTGTAYSKSFPLPKGVSFGWEVKLGGTGTKAVTVELEQGNSRPATEGASDSSWSVPDLNAGNPMFTLADTNLHSNPYAPTPMAFGRLKFTGTGANDASTTVTVARRYIIQNFG